MEGSIELGVYGQKGIAHRDVPAAPPSWFSLPRQVKPHRGAFSNPQQLFVCRAGDLSGVQSPLPHPQPSPFLPGHNPVEH